MRIFNYIIVASMAIMALACAEPEQPTATQMAIGNWEVAEYYVNGQTDGSSVINRFTLERDGSFILEDNNGILFAGTWTATDTQLTLTQTGDGGQVFDFTIVFQSYTKMQLLQVISSPSAGDIEIRYLMDLDDTGRYYGSGS